MSTRIMALCWPLRMPPTAKAVLISLADNANDAGHCWPSIDAICERTCFGRTAVIEAIKWLEDAGFVIANRANGRHTTYVVNVENQSGRRTGPADEPVRETDDTSPGGGLDPSGRRTAPVRQADSNRQEPSMNRQGTVNRPPEVPEQVWADFIAIRKANRAPLTETALAGIEREAMRAGLSLADALAVCCERGWRGFKADWWSPHKGNERAGPQWWTVAGYGDERTAIANGVMPPGRRMSSAAKDGLALAGLTGRNSGVVDV